MYFALGDYLCMEYGCKGKYMKETPRRGLRLCRLLMKYSKSAGKQGGWGGKGGGPASVHLFLQQAYGQEIK